jgi:hypothetical protein
VALLGKFPRTDSWQRNCLSRPSPPHYPRLRTMLPPPFRTTLWDAPSPPHCSGTCFPPRLALGRAFPLASLWDVPSPSPRTGTHLCSGTHPLFSFFFVLRLLSDPPLTHRREGVGFFHDAAPFRSQTHGVTLYLVRFFMFFLFFFVR